MTELEKPKFPFRELASAGADAPKVLVDHVVRAQCEQITVAASAARTARDFDVEEYVDRLVSSQIRLVRAEGAGAGLVTSLVEFSSAITGPAAVAAIGTTVVADLGVLAYYQVQLSLRIAAAYGHDVTDVEARVREILSLHALETVASRAGVAAGTGRAGQRVGRRLLEKYLRGPLLQALKAMFRLVGIKFSRAALVRGLPFINVPANAAIADITTRRTALKARNYYRALPPVPARLRVAETG